ncbi:MAG: delta 1-pyrroline-5-carboxylate synthetase, partial [Methanobacterium sp.]|uniref:amino acid kinase family protein n=1 Tax=Methanobacterium sp. TaxID=2164 RepID=UPI003C76B964
SLFPEKAINLCEAVIALNDSLESPKKIVFICGGGGFANKIRNYNRDIHFSDTANHNSAIMCMDIVGTLLADKVNGLESVKSLDMIDLVLKQGKLPLLNPSALIESHDVLEHSWRVTSDSIAMYIADLIKAKLLIATDVDGIYTHDPCQDDAKLIKIISAKKLLNFGETSVDEFLPELLLKYKSNCYVVNGKYPERVISIIKGKRSKYTLIGGI